MDRLESLSSTLSQITMYDIKSMYNQAKNVVLNVSEMEAKVREATNDDPWGASSTLMQEIAQATFSFQYFNEVMPCIYARFMEKEARQWRQIYKALQLLEYLVKHGSERVVDDARSHISTIKMLRNFHYIDDKGKDEGINVRNRSREIAEMLSDVEKIRAERRKAKATKHKYTGTGNDDVSFSGSSGGRYGGFGSDSLGGGGSSYSGGGDNDYGGGGSYAGGSSSGSGFRDESRRAGGFDEYDAGDDEVAAPVRSNSLNSSRNSASTPTTRATPQARMSVPVVPAPAPVKEETLFDVFGDDDDFGAPVPAPVSFNSVGVNKALPAPTPPAAAIDEDDFADFQAAPVTPQVNTFMKAAPPIAQTKPNLMDLLNSTPAMGATPVRQQQQQPAMMHASRPSLSGTNSFGSFGGGAAIQPSFGSGAPIMQANALQPSKPYSPPNLASTPAAKPAASANFDDLWSMSLGSSATASKGPAVSGGKSIKDLEKEKAMAGLWGNTKAPMGQQSQTKPADPFGSFGTSNMGGSSNASGGDDFLL